MRFQYYLENFDKDWSPHSSINEVTYSNLPPGNYLFHVKSTNKQGSWAAEEIIYPFTIQAPFYQTASFIVGTMATIIGLIILILYVRVKSRVNRVITTERIRIREQELLRKEISRDFHDEMGNQLTRIINYVSLLKLNGTNGHSHENGNHNDLYTKVENSAKYLYSGTRDFIWAIDPVNDELSKLFIHIRDFGDKLFEEKNMSFRAFNKIKEPIKLPYGFSREANLIFKEAMTNAFKYSQANNITFRLERVEQGAFQLTLEDDGVGFYTGDIDKLNGLKNIRERADRIKSVIRITSIKNHGTKIVLVFTLTKTLKYGLAV
jgi:signal transduction histidine kinase